MKIRMWSPGSSRSSRSWWRLFAPSLMVMVLTSGATTVAGIGLARLLEPKELGKYMLLVSLAGILSLLGSLGQPGLMKRVYALGPPSTYDWLHDIRHGVLYALPALTGTLIIVSLLYRLHIAEAVLLAVLLLLSLLVLFVMQVLLSSRRYVRGNLLIRLPNALLVVPLLLFGLSGQPLNFAAVVSLRLLSALFALGLGTYWLLKEIKRGPEVIARSARRQGGDYLALGITSLLSGDGTLALAGLVLAPAELGVLAALIVLTRPYQMVRLVAVQVLSVEAAQRNWMPRGRHYVRFSLVTLSATALIVVWFPALITWVYGGRYNDYGSLGLPLMLAAAFALLEASPRGAIIGCARPSFVRIYSVTQSALALLGALAIIALGHSAGIRGVVWTLCIYTLVQYIVSAGAAYLLLPSRSIDDRPS